MVRLRSISSNAIYSLPTGLDVDDLISRAPPRMSRADDEQWGERTASGFKVVGRHVLNLWRLMRQEKHLNIYTFENVVFHVLCKRYLLNLVIPISTLMFPEFPDTVFPR